MTDPVFTHLLVPLANVDDAQRTCQLLAQYIDSTVEVITVIYVIEQAEGYMDPTSPEVFIDEAQQVFSIVRDYFKDGPEIRHELRTGSDTVQEIVDAADELGVSAIGFSPRPKTKLQQWLTENTSYRLITESHHPVVVFSKGLQEGT